MSDSNDLIMAALLRIEGTVARTDAKLDGLDAKVTTHIRDDKEVEHRVMGLEASYNRMSGRATVWAIVSSAAFAIVGWFITRH